MIGIESHDIRLIRVSNHRLNFRMDKAIDQLEKIVLPSVSIEHFLLFIQTMFTAHRLTANLP